MADIIEDKILIQRYLKGDEKSLEILIARYLKPIYSFVYKNVGNMAEAEDITQEVFIKISNHRKRVYQRSRLEQNFLFFKIILV